jgi:uncharacterized membrane protein YeaQ/YmgE (transglycosylase-associated protein family)
VIPDNCRFLRNRAASIGGVCEYRICGYFIQGETTMWVIWDIIIGFVAGLVARWLVRGPKNPQGFILTTVLGIVGAFVATWIGQAIGWYQPDQGAGLIGAIVGAVVVLFIWHRLVAARVIGDPGAGR